MSARWLVSPHLTAWQKKVLRELRRRVAAACAKDIEVWVMSSGTQSVNQIKCIGLSRSALESSARAVNVCLGAGSRDHWLVAIPTYHVGGYSIGVRAQLSGSKVSSIASWSVAKFLAAIEKNKVTLCSLVPAQVYDLVSEAARCPISLRAVVVGGGSLDESLYFRARGLGWPVLPSYGLTETGSQVATAPLSSLKRSSYPALAALSHARLEMRDGRLWIRAESLASLVATANTDGEFSLEDPRRNGWLRTEDIAEKTAGGWRILGRGDDVVKVLGVLVAIPQVESEARDFFRSQAIGGSFTILTRPAEREGRELILVTDSETSLSRLARQIDQFNERSPGPQRLRSMVWTPVIPRTPLGKVMKASLAEALL